MNKSILIGRITKDIELKYTGSQMAVAKFSIAIDRGKDKDGNDKGADFIPVTVFGRQAENTERFTGKGSLIAIEGHIQTGSYEKDGEKRFTMDVIADRVEFIDHSKKNDERGNQSLTEASKPPQSTAPKQEMFSGFQAIDDDIPFN